LFAYSFAKHAMAVVLPSAYTVDVDDFKVPATVQQGSSFTSLLIAM